jgi:signal transduction histidine kinase
MRVFGFVTVVACGSIVLAWITHSLWDQLDRLQKDHAAIKSESFYLGVHIRGSLRGLNEKLLQFGSSHDPTFKDAFLNDSADLGRWIATNKVLLSKAAQLQTLKAVDTTKQLQILEQLMTNYDGYISNAQRILEAPKDSATPASFEALYKDVRQISSSLFPLCDDLVATEREGFGEFLRETQKTLIDHQWLLTVSSAIILSMTVILSLLVYRGMIAPLRLGLSESTSIIERQEKLASLGILASGVAHEIRNPLTAIKFRLFSVKKAVPVMGQNEDLLVISNEINRLETIVQQFLQFARPADPALARVELGALIQTVQQLFQPQLASEAIDLRLDLETEVEAYADAQQIKQILVNLIKNSSESIGRNGTITLGLRVDAVELEGRSRPAGVISVTDSGKGIPADVESRLFDPFFTTKEQGTGLGLAISARIAEKHGGLLRYETELNRGTVFELVLPAVEKNAS